MNKLVREYFQLAQLTQQFEAVIASGSEKDLQDLIGRRAKCMAGIKAMKKEVQCTPEERQRCRRILKETAALEKKNISFFRSKVAAVKAQVKTMRRARGQLAKIKSGYAHKHNANAPRILDRIF